MQLKEGGGAFLHFSLQFGNLINGSNINQMRHGEAEIEMKIIIENDINQRDKKC